jgi:hypothetical protein
LSLSDCSVIWNLGLFFYETVISQPDKMASDIHYFAKNLKVRGISLIIALGLLLFISTIASCVESSNPQFLSEDGHKHPLSGNLIIALDNSDSMNGTKIIAAKNASKRFIERASSIGFKTGFVGWNNVIDSSIYPSFDTKNLYDEIDNLNANGRTCIGLGLREAIELLEKNDGTNLSKIIILISDGEENCTENETPCLDSKRAAEKGIVVFTIGVTPLTKTEPLKCIANTTGGQYFYANDDFALEKIFGNIYQLMMPYQQGPKFGLVANGSIISVKELETNVTIQKSILYNERNSSPGIMLTVKTPPIDRLDMVIALDSSGSVNLWNEERSMRDGLKYAINNFIKELKNRNIDARISIISWDDNIDFAYGNISNTDVRNASLVQSDQITETILDRIMNNYSCDEEDLTDFNVGLENSILILNNKQNKPKYPDAFRCIVFLAGRSEFRDCTNATLTNIENSHYKIYPIGLNPGRKMEGSLSNISRITGSKYIYSTGTRTDLKLELDKLLKEFLDKSLNETPVANNVVIVESLYPYLKPDLDSVNGARINGFNDTTNSLFLEIPGGLLSGHTYEISFDTRINLDLPVDVAERRKPVIFPILNGTPESTITYVWHTNKNYTIPLPENHIVIKNNDRNIDKAIKKSPANFGLLSAIALLLVLLRKRGQIDE